MFKSTDTLRWIYSANSRAILSIKGCTVVASYIPYRYQGIHITGTTTTASASPCTPFHTRPNYEECQHASIKFSKSPDLISRFAVGLASITAPVLQFQEQTKASDGTMNQKTVRMDHSGTGLQRGGSFGVCLTIPMGVDVS